MGLDYQKKKKLLWMLGGKRKMEELDIVIDSFGHKNYYKKGTKILHRESGPAIEWADGSKSYFINDKAHRLDGPAYESYKGNKEYYINGKLHREDGPAIDWLDISEVWANLEEVDVIEHIFDVKFYDLEFEKSAKYYEFKGYKAWYINGRLHRADGPAVECNQFNAWLINGRLHRENGPAVIFYDGTEHWFIDGIRLSPEKESIMNIWWEKKNGI